MRIKLTINFRKFNDVSERNDSGSYSGLNIDRKASIHIRRTDPPLEQALTLYHEVTHALLDLFLDYEITNRSKGKTKARRAELRRKWDEFNRDYKKRTGKTLDLEEEICAKVERAVKRILKKEVPPEFFNELFGK